VYLRLSVERVVLNLDGILVQRVGIGGSHVELLVGISNSF